MIYSDNTYDITTDISTYPRRDFKSVFDTTLQKWYMLNNLGEYEEYGIYGTDFSTSYVGKLVIVNDEEYEWDGTEWDNLGPITTVTSLVGFKQYFASVSDYSTKSIDNIHYDPAGLGKNTQDTYFASTPNNKSSIIPRTNTGYNGGTITDTGFTDKKINTLPTDTYGYYYYNFGRNIYLCNYGNSFNSYGNFASWNYIYTETSVQSWPKTYETKSAPTIYKKFPSKLYRNCNYMNKLYLNDEVINILDYMDGKILNQGTFPPDYNDNAYIQFSESTGYADSALFITDLHLKNTYTFEIKFKTATNGNKFRLIAGSYENNNINNGRGWGFQSSAVSTGAIMTFWNYGAGTRSYDNNYFPLPDNTMFLLSTNIGTGVTTVNGTTYTGHGNNGTGTLVTYLQFGNVKQQNNDNGFNGKIYYIKIIEGTEIVAYYHADNSNGVLGFYDSVSGTKYTNQGTGTISYGVDE